MAFLGLNGFFVARIPGATRPELAWVSAAFVIVLALPAFWSAWRQAGWRRGTLVIGGLGIFAICIEAFAVATGYPYGPFQYGDQIGFKFFGTVPWTVFFAWSPLVLATLPLVNEPVDASPVGIWAKRVAWLVAFDLVLDPGAVSQGFWAFGNPGWYFGVPFSNYLGWIFSGLIGVAMAQRGLEPLPVHHGKRYLPSLAASAFLSLSFWASVCLCSGMWLPGTIGVFLLARMWQSLRPK